MIKNIFIVLIISYFQFALYHQHAKTCLFENEIWIMGF